MDDIYDNVQGTGIEVCNHRVAHTTFLCIARGHKPKCRQQRVLKSSNLSKANIAEQARPLLLSL